MEEMVKNFKKKESYKLVAGKLAEFGEHELVLELFKHKVSHDRRDLTVAERRVMVESYLDSSEKISKRIQKAKGFRNSSRNEEEVEFLSSYIKNLEGDYMKMCCSFADTVTILETFAQSHAMKVSYLTLTARVYEGAAKVESVSYKRKNFSGMAVKFFEKAKVIADKHLSPVNRQRLYMMTQYAGFNNSTSGGLDGSRIAKEAFDLAGAEIQKRGMSVPDQIQILLDELATLL